MVGNAAHQISFGKDATDAGLIDHGHRADPPPGEQRDRFANLGAGPNRRNFRALG